MKKGIFWCRGYNTGTPELITVSVQCNEYGIPYDDVCFSSKSGENFNHMTEWNRLDRHITERHPYNYYPRGRVEISNRRATVFLNPDINNKEIITLVKSQFELYDLKNVTVKSDGTTHYGYTCRDC